MNLTLRPAQPTDAGATGAILARFQQDAPWMPKLYSAAQCIGFCGEMIDRGWVTVAVCVGKVVGFIARDDQEICALYVSGSVRGQKVGARLMEAAKTGADRLWLLVFEVNEPARRFYIGAGFVEAGRGDGTDGEAGLAHVSYVWQRGDR